MTDPSGIKPIAGNPAAQTGGKGQVVQIVSLPEGLESSSRAIRLQGEVVRQNQDGTVRINTPEGAIDIQVRGRQPQAGQRVEIDIPPGSPPKQANIRPAPTQAPPPAQPPPAPQTPAQPPAATTPPLPQTPPAQGQPAPPPQTSGTTQPSSPSPTQKPPPLPPPADSVQDGYIPSQTKQVAQTQPPLPPLEEQRLIVAEVERRLSVARQVESSVEEALVRASRLRQAVLKSAFEGRLT